MAIIDTQRPALEAVRPPSDYWLEDSVLDPKKQFYFWVDEKDEDGKVVNQVQVYCAGVHGGIGIYAKLQGVRIAGFVKKEPKNPIPLAELAGCAYGVLLREAPEMKGSPMMEVVLLKPLGVSPQGGSQTHVYFEDTDRRATYVQLV